MKCQNCLTQVAPGEHLCSRCGAEITTQPQVEVMSPQDGFTSSVPVSNPQQAVARGFGMVFDLHPASTFITLAANGMAFTGDGAAALLALPTGGVSVAVTLAFSTVLGAAVGYITYKAEREWHGDNHESAKIKALITGLLTAIPTGLPGMLFASVAVANWLFRKKS